MTKSDKNLIERAELFGDPRALAATVATIYRCGSSRTQKEIRDYISKNRAVWLELTWVNGCPVPRI